MKKKSIVRITESELVRVIKKIIKESEGSLPIQEIGNEDFNYDLSKYSSREILLKGDKGGRSIKPVVYKLKGEFGFYDFDIIINSLKLFPEYSLSNMLLKQMTKSILKGQEKENDTNPNAVTYSDASPTVEKEEVKSYGVEVLVKADSIAWNTAKNMIANEGGNVVGDYIKINIPSSKIRNALEQLSRNNGMFAVIPVGDLTLTLLKTRTL